jgi:hypothetical protein
MHLIGRRNFLAGLGLGAGAPLLGSVFTSALLPEAQGAPALKKRFILVTSGNGFLERFYTCPARSETDFDLTPALMPVAPWKDRMVLAQKFFNPYSKANHGNQFATLTVTESPVRESQMRGPPGGISIDRLIAKTLGAGDAIESTAVGCVAFRQGSTYSRALCMSANGPREPFPAFGSPVQAFRAYFGAAPKGATPGGAATPDTFERSFAKSRSFLDPLTEEVRRLRGRLAGAERAKLDQYLASLEVVEKELAQRAEAQGRCADVAGPALPETRGALDENVDPEVLAGHIDVTFNALRCGLTHVSHITIEGMEAPHVKYKWLGQTRDHHNDHHDNNLPVLEKIGAWTMAQVAKVCTLLANAPEGNGSMLDNSLVVYVNCCGGKHHDGQNVHPVFMFAGKNIGLRGGRYLQYPEGKHCISDIYCSLANLFLDRPITVFGNPQPCKGPLPGLV